MIIQPFMILRRFEALHMIIGKDYAHAILDRDEGLHAFLQPFEGLFYNPWYVWRIECTHCLYVILQRVEGLKDTSEGDGNFRLTKSITYFYWVFSLFWKFWASIFNTKNLKWRVSTYNWYCHCYFQLTLLFLLLFLLLLPLAFLMLFWPY